MKKRQIGKYLVVDPEICRGRMTFKDTRIPVGTVLTLMAKGYSIQQLVASYPELSRPAIEQAVLLARKTLLQQYRLQPPRRLAPRRVAA